MSEVPEPVAAEKPAAGVPRSRLLLVAMMLAVLGLIAVLGPGERAVPGLGRFIGRFHVVVLHFPIGFLALALMLEVCRLPLLRQVLPVASPGVMVLILGLGALSAWAAAVCGWLLSVGGGYQGDAITRHFYGGLLTAAGAAVALLLRFICDLRPGFRLGALYLFVLTATNGVLVLTGHMGGVVTHGEIFLTEYAPQFIRSALGLPESRAASGAAFDSVVLPILQAKCTECHNPQKAKGKLRMDSYVQLVKGGSSGAAVIPGKPDESELLRRVHLPEDHDDHMPPRGKPQLTAAEAELLTWWVRAGAPEARTVQELAPPPEIQRLLKR